VRSIWGFIPSRSSMSRQIVMNLFDGDRRELTAFAAARAAASATCRLALMAMSRPRVRTPHRRSMPGRGRESHPSQSPHTRSPEFSLALGGHVYQMVTAHNFAPGNADIIFWSDILLPLVGFALLWLQRRRIEIKMYSQ
jgi:hypothetical protein